MNWKSNDKAVCIRTLPWYDPFGSVASGPINGQIYCVEYAVQRRNAIGLGLTGFPNCQWDADEFRRIIPSSERITEKKPETITL
jgi:hypothetical protein